MKYFFASCVVFVVLSLGLGLYFSGSPKEVRATRLDDARITALANIQNSIGWYYRDTKKLPDTLQLLNDHVGGLLINDPETQQPFEYTVKSETKFELCASFLRKDTNIQERVNSYPYSVPSTENGIIQGSNWSHSQGRFCFDRELNPEYFKVQNQIPPIKS